MNNYNLVLEVIESYEIQDVLNDFLETFEPGQNITHDEYNKFCYKYIDDESEWYYINLNWRYIVSGGDESVYDGAY